MQIRIHIYIHSLVVVLVQLCFHLPPLILIALILNGADASPTFKAPSHFATVGPPPKRGSGLGPQLARHCATQRMEPVPSRATAATPSSASSSSWCVKVAVYVRTYVCILNVSKICSYLYTSIYIYIYIYTCCASTSFHLKLVGSRTHV